MPDFDRSFFSGYSDHTVGIDACLFAISRGAKIIEKHFSNNKSLNVQTQAAHIGSMDMHDLENIRKFSDSFNLLRINAKKNNLISDIKYDNASWSFDGKTVKKFDHHIQQSIPLYR